MQLSNGTSNFKTFVFPLTDFTSVSFKFISPRQLHQQKSQNHVRHLLIQIMRAHRPGEDLTHFYKIRYLTTKIPQQDHIIVFAPRIKGFKDISHHCFRVRQYQHHEVCISFRNCANARILCIEGKVCFFCWLILSIR